MPRGEQLTHALENDGGRCYSEIHCFINLWVPQCPETHFPLSHRHPPLLVTQNCLLDTLKVSPRLYCKLSLRNMDTAWPISWPQKVLMVTGGLTNHPVTFYKGRKSTLGP
ncbi:hypothetical protein ElyMa_006800300 [Elysia marginata]|uniref:Uncharacterized protein n=1 Tax=Elysia marginata TaxID=1093978 RepID=A0AAV4J2G4_9GAST|nr:hypothetical protein ElyMa_006800300 [Elysia marginata]